MQDVANTKEKHSLNDEDINSISLFDEEKTVKRIVRVDKITEQQRLGILGNVRLIRI